MDRPSRPPSPRRLAWLLVLVLLPSLSGCLGIERTEWAFSATQVTTLENQGLDGSGVTIGIVDTGIDPGHPALDHIPIVAWRDYVGQRATPYDDTGHGTHVAGIIAADSKGGDFFSGAKVKGVAPGVSLIVVKACGQDECNSQGVERGIAWAVAQGADIITLSLGGRQTLIDLGPSAERAVQDAVEKGVYVVAAAGNAGSDHGDVESPASAALAIAVGAVDSELRVAEFSSRGGESANQGTRVVGGQGFGGRADPNKKPEVVAPGVDILSTWLDGGYAVASGTSQAAPFVAGIVALLLDEYPQWKRNGSESQGAESVETMKTVLTESAKTVPGQRTPHDNAAGYGLVQAQGALRRLAAQ